MILMTLKLMTDDDSDLDGDDVVNVDCNDDEDGDVDDDIDEDGDVDEVVGCSKYLIPASLPHRSVVRHDKLMINSNIKVSCELLSFWSYFSIGYKSLLIEYHFVI